ncbi:hypothetical protein MNV49_004992 [Pseudohyphozyma bogoriensis]|nr:hypothetical protein MNV49_004992 [Pseudohyphozyma bogoriensis]
MGRSAKMMKRPTKAEKVSRAVNNPAPRRRSRSLSPDEGPRSAIPLFNTSAKRLKSRLQMADDIMSLDSSKAPTPAESPAAMDASEFEQEGGPSTSEPAAKKKKSLKDKVRAAKESVREGEDKSKAKLGVLKGVDYVKLHEKRPGGSFKKKFR